VFGVPAGEPEDPPQLGAAGRDITATDEQPGPSAWNWGRSSSLPSSAAREIASSNAASAASYAPATLSRSPSDDTAIPSAQRSPSAEKSSCAARVSAR
jgi:hypothetical protein